MQQFDQFIMLSALDARNADARGRLLRAQAPSRTNDALVQLRSALVHFNSTFRSSENRVNALECA